MGAEIVDGLDVRDDEIVLDRMRMSAFHGTSLDAMLRNLGVSDVTVVGGLDEHGCRALNYALTNIATITDTASVTAALRDRS